MNADEKRVYMVEWRARNRERLQEYERARYLRIRDEKLRRMKEYHRETYPERRERIIERVRIYRANNPDKVRECEARWRVNNREAFLKNRRRSEGTRRARRRNAFVEVVDSQVVFEQSGGVCGICGEAADENNFHIDHIIPLSRGGEHSYRNTQASHPRCNRKKWATV